MEETGQPFDVALAVTRAGNLFTTHTAVAAGFDRSRKIAFGCPARQGGEEKGLLPEAAPIL
jgi:hypothetical protein